MNSPTRRSSFSPVRSLLSSRVRPSLRREPLLLWPTLKSSARATAHRGQAADARLWDASWLDRLTVPLSRIRE